MIEVTNRAGSRSRGFSVQIFRVGAWLFACLALSLHAPPGALAQGSAPSVTCEPTPKDSLGPFYKPVAPIRFSVGRGYVLSGAVRSAEGCAVIPHARIEAWLAGPSGDYGDEFRATLFTDSDGRYRFESHVPPPYMGRPPHIHLRVSAQGFETLVTQHYPEKGLAASNFDLVLRPLH